MPDMDAIAAAIAARYAAAAVTPPAGLANIRSSSADLPQTIGRGTPLVLVFPDRGTLEAGNGTRLGQADFLVRFYFALTKDLARETNACRRWLTVLLDQHRAALQLGGLVVAVRTASWRIGALPYAGSTYTGIELGVRAVTSEPWSPTA